MVSVGFVGVFAVILVFLDGLVFVEVVVVDTLVFAAV